MGIISDIIELVKDAKKGREEFSASNFAFRTTRNSISRKSANSILQFPVICSGALSVDDLMIITKSLEREYCQFVRIAASLDDVIDSDKPQAKMEKIRSLHQNIGYNSQMSVGMRNGSFFMESNDLTYTTLYESFEKKNIELLKIVNEDLNPTILNDMSNKNNRNYYNLNEADDDKKDPKYEELQSNRLKQQMKYDRETHGYQVANLQWQNKYNVGREAREKEIHRHNIAKSNRDKELHDLRKADFEMKKNQILTRTSPFKDQMLPTDVRKANELVPSMLDLTFLYNNGYQMAETHIVVGVKAVSHLVSSEEMITNIASAVKDKRHFFHFLQWTTGEIEMVKDWILAKDKIKDEVNRQRAGKESNWWRRLKGRSAEDKLRRFSFTKKDVLPNSTLVLTMDEVEIIQNTYNINLLKDRRAINALFDTFFLLGLVIVDSATEVAYFRFDGEEDWQTQSYRSLEKENSSASDMKSLISLMDRNGRR